MVDWPTAQISFGEDADAARRLLLVFSFGVGTTLKTVSYTHLDVYKRQAIQRALGPGSLRVGRQFEHGAAETRAVRVAAGR